MMKLVSSRPIERQQVSSDDTGHSGYCVDEHLTFRYINHYMVHKKKRGKSTVKKSLKHIFKVHNLSIKIIRGFHVLACLTEVEWNLIQSHRRMKG